MTYTLRLLGSLALTGCLVTVLDAQPARPGTDTAGARPDPRSPRVAVEEFLVLARRGDFDAAARFLGAGGTPERARRLKAVLDRHLWVELDRVSPHAAGDTADGLDAGVDALGTVVNEAGAREHVYIRRTAAGANPAWVFDPRTVARTDAWYAALGDIWLRALMPPSLQQPGFLGIELWQWLMLALLLPVALAAGWLAGRLTILVARRATLRTRTTLDDRLLERVRGFLTALWFIVAYRAFVDAVGLSIGAEQVVSLLARVVGVVIVAWLFVRTTFVLEEALPSSPWAAERPELRALVPVVGRVLRIMLVAIGAITVVAQFGYKVTTLVAGLGIGGIALALAAQKTLEHGFGSIAIGLDQPIRVGDWVRVDTTEGVVEEIGFRSTRIRTLARSVVVIPNGRLAEAQMENFGVRDRILLRTQLGIEYGTTASRLRQVRDGIERVLADHPLVWREKIIVRFVSFGTYSLDIEIIAWIATTDMDVFRAAREEIFFRFMEVVEGAGCSFAFPTQTVHLRTSPPA